MFIFQEIEDMDSFMNWVIFVVNQLNIYGEDINNERVVEKGG